MKLWLGTVLLLGLGAAGCVNNNAGGPAQNVYSEHGINKEQQDRVSSNRISDNQRNPSTPFWNMK